MQYEDQPSQMDVSEGVVSDTPEISLPIEDKDFVAIIDQKIAESQAYYKDKAKLEARRQLNEDFWIGKQYDESKLLDYEIPYKDNIIYQDLETRVAYASSKMPDIITTPAGNDEAKKESAKMLEKALDIKVHNDINRRLVKSGLRNLELYLQSAIKCYWDSKRNDFVYELVKPQSLLVDHNATIPFDGFTADNMEFIVETIEEPLSVVLAKFPKKRDELLKELGIVRGTPRQLVSKIKYQEIWFTWYGKEGEPIEGVAWKFNKLVLDKMKHPYWDWKGYKSPLKNDEMRLNEETGQYETEEQLYRNHFDRPRKPYMFFSYQNLGRNSLESTTAVEQSIPLQRVVNKQGRQILELADQTIAKLIFAGKYITKEDAERVTHDPKEKVWLENAERASDGIAWLQGQPVSPVLYQNLLDARAQIDSKFATHATTRGARIANESGTARQILKDGDLSISDDIVRTTVDRQTYEMANWAVQMMKTQYTDEHFIRQMGKDGEMIEILLKQDKIDDGIDVNVKASSVDKEERRANALTLVAKQQIDPLSLAEDLDLPNPKERVTRLIPYLMGDYATYAQVVGVQMPQQQQAGMAPAAGGQTIPPEQAPGAPQPTQGAEGAAQAQSDIQAIIQGQDVTPTTISPEYLIAISEFVNSQDFAQLSPDIQAKFQEFIKKLRQLAGM